MKYFLRKIFNTEVLFVLMGREIGYFFHAEGTDFGHYLTLSRVVHDHNTPEVVEAFKTLETHAENAISTLPA